MTALLEYIDFVAKEQIAVVLMISITLKYKLKSGVTMAIP